MKHGAEKKIARFRDPVAALLLLCAALVLGGLYFVLAPAPKIELSESAAAQKRAKEKAQASQTAKKTTTSATPAKAPASTPAPAPAFRVSHKSDGMDFASRPADFVMKGEKFVAAESGTGKAVSAWKGDGDLSASVWVGHDNEYLVVQTDVRDNKHFHKAGTRAAADLFTDDSLQIALIVPGVGSQWEFGFALTDTGRLVRNCWMTPIFKTPLKPAEIASVVEGIDLEVQRLEGGLRYIVKFPLKFVRLSKDHLKQGIRMNVLVNDTDEEKEPRKCWMELTAGIGKTKENTTFAEIKFAK